MRNYVHARSRYCSCPICKIKNVKLLIVLDNFKNRTAIVQDILMIAYMLGLHLKI